MAKAQVTHPTNAELDILRVLWELGSGTVREVQERLNGLEREGSTGYTTALKLMQIMTEKGLLERDERERAHVYRPAVAREKTQRAMVGHLLERAFAGSASELMMQALAAKKVSPEELRELREFLAAYEAQGKAGTR